MQVLRNCASTAFRFGNLLAGNAANTISSVLGQPQRNLCSLITRNGMNMNGISGQASLLEAPSVMTTTVRTKTRNHFPKPREVKRLRVHGLKTRLKTPGGRRIIINNILKGKHILAHGW